MLIHTLEVTPPLYTEPITVADPCSILPARAASSVLGHYQVIVADPPWRFKVWSRDTGMGRSAESHYRTMSLEAIQRMPVAELAAPDCALFLWATWPMLREALEVGEAWGFTYATLGFDWQKLTVNGKWHVGMGYRTRANPEPCLLFVKGNPKRQSKGVRQLIVDEADQLELPLIAKIGPHSAKPEEAYLRIEALYPGPYLYLFSRDTYPGWDHWGDQAPNCIDWQRHCPSE